MSTHKERNYITQYLMHELADDFQKWAKEYQQPRDLGIRGEFANFYRKARKLKTFFWDNWADPPSDWREDPRTIIKEVIAHGLLMLVDLDTDSGRLAEAMSDDETDTDFLRKRPAPRFGRVRRHARPKPEKKEACPVCNMRENAACANVWHEDDEDDD
jgi:hypothetical protein